MRGEVEIEIDLNGIADHMGAVACRSKGGLCKDGYVRVKRVGTPVELAREPWPRS